MIALDESYLRQQDKDDGRSDSGREEQKVSRDRLKSETKEKLKLNLDYLQESNKHSSSGKHESKFFSNRDTMNSDLMLGTKNNNFAAMERALVSAKARDVVQKSLRFFPGALK